MELKSRQYRQVHEALLDAFRSRTDLQFMVRLRLEKNLNEIAKESNLHQTVSELIIWAERTGRILELIGGAAEEVPGNSKLKQLLKDSSTWTELDPVSESSLQGGANGSSSRRNKGASGLNHERQTRVERQNSAVDEQSKTMEDRLSELERLPLPSVPQWVYDDQTRIMSNMNEIKSDSTTKIIPVAMGTTASFTVSSASKGVHIAHVTVDSKEQLTMQGWMNHRQPRSVRVNQSLPGWPNREHDWVFKQLVASGSACPETIGEGSFDQTIVLTAVWIRHIAKDKRPEDILILIGHET